MKKLIFLIFCTVSAIYADTNLLNALSSPILFKGDDTIAYRDPAVLYHNQIFYLYFTLVQVEQGGAVYSYTAQSKSTDLQNWTDPEIITPKGQALNYCSPGNVIRFQDQWVLCLQTYPRPDYNIKDQPVYGNQTARVFIMKSDDLEHWSEPELLKVKGSDVQIQDMGRMIDPYLIKDKDDSDKWWCFYKQNGVSMSWSRDLENWTFFGHTQSGENVCVLIENDEYLLFHSPSNGIGIKRSSDLKTWQDWGELITLDQQNWPWAKGRLTAATVIDLRHVPGIERYVMFFHGSGPEPESKMFDQYASIGIAWSKNLQNWEWPGK